MSDEVSFLWVMKFLSYEWWSLFVLDNCIMSQLPVFSKQEQKDEGYLRLFLTFSALTKDFFVTILRKEDEIDLEEYLTVQAWIYF